VERRRTATATGLYDSFCHIFFSFYTVSHYIYLSQKSLNDEERGGNCLLIPERSYGPEIYKRVIKSGNKAIMAR